MPILAVLDESNYSSLDGFTKKLYVKNEKDNNFYLDIAADEAGKLAVNLQSEVERLKKQNFDVIGEKKAAQEKAKAYEELGKTPEEIAEFYKTKGNVDVDKLKADHAKEVQGICDSVKAEVESAQTEIKAAQDKEKQAFEQLRSEMKQTEKARQMREFNTTKLADDFLERRIAVVPESEDSNRFVVRVVNEKGEIEYKAGQPKTVDQLLEETKANKDYAGMFYAAGGGGTGGTSRQASGGGTNYANLPARERLKQANRGAT